MAKWHWLSLTLNLKQFYLTVCGSILAKFNMLVQDLGIHWRLVKGCCIPAAAPCWSDPSVASRKWQRGVCQRPGWPFPQVSSLRAPLVSSVAPLSRCQMHAAHLFPISALCLPSRLSLLLLLLGAAFNCWRVNIYRVRWGWCSDGVGGRAMTSGVRLSKHLLPFRWFALWIPSWRNWRGIRFKPVPWGAC